MAGCPTVPPSMGRVIASTSATKSQSGELPLDSLGSTSAGQGGFDVGRPAPASHRLKVLRLENAVDNPNKAVGGLHTLAARVGLVDFGVLVIAEEQALTVQQCVDLADDSAATRVHQFADHVVQEHVVKQNLIVRVKKRLEEGNGRKRLIRGREHGELGVRIAQGFCNCGIGGFNGNAESTQDFCEIGIARGISDGAVIEYSGPRKSDRSLS